MIAMYRMSIIVLSVDVAVLIVEAVEDSVVTCPLSVLTWPESVETLLAVARVPTCVLTPLTALFRLENPLAWLELRLETLLATPLTAVLAPLTAVVRLENPLAWLELRLENPLAWLELRLEIAEFTEVNPAVIEVNPVFTEDVREVTED